MHRFSACRALVLTFSLAWLVGCTTGDPAPPPSPVKDGLEELGEVYKFLAAQNLRPPAKKSDFDEHEAAMQTAHAKIGAGDYVVYYGVGYAASSSDILAYEKDAATAGGKVLLRNGTVKQLTASEFQAAPKAKK